MSSLHLLAGVPLADVLPPPTLAEPLVWADVHLPPGSTLALTLLAAAVALLALWTLAAALWSRAHRVPCSYDQRFDVATDDGCTITLSRLRAAAPTVALPPVLIIHGLAINERNCDAHPDLSLARHLAAAGRDVWLVTLRSARLDVPWLQRPRLNFAAMVHHDVPLAVAIVRDRTGAAALDLIGFSMGGILLYAALGRTVARAQVRRVVIMGSPGRVRIPLWPLRLLRDLPPRLAAALAWLAPPMPYRWLSSLVVPLAETFETPIHRAVVQLRNAAPGLTRVTMVDAVRSVPWALHRDFARWALSDGDIRVGGARCLDGLGPLDVPVRFYAGAADGLAAPDSVRVAFDAWGASAAGVDKAITVLGRATGCADDYGHGDLTFGRNCQAEVFAPIAAFLQQVDPA